MYSKDVIFIIIYHRCMRTHIKTTGFSLTSSLQEYIESKVGELHKFTSTAGADNDPPKKGHSAVEVFVEVGKTKGGQKKGDDLYMAEIQVHLPGSERIVVRAEEWNIHRAIDQAKAEMKGKLQRHKGKRKAKFLRKAGALKRLSRVSFLARRDNTQE